MRSALVTQITARLIVAGLVLVGMAGCKHLPSRELESYGLPMVELDIDDPHLAELNSTVAQKTPIPARIRFDGRSYRGTVHYSGRSTIDDYKKSMEIELDGERFRGLKTWRLSSQQGDRSMLRSWFGFQVFATMGLATPKAEHCVVYLNGQYRGIYLLMESIDDDFWSTRQIPVGVYYKAVFGNATLRRENLTGLEKSFEIKGYPETPADIFQLIERVNDPASTVESMVDLDNVLGYMAAAVFLHHVDGFRNNYFIYRHKTYKTFQMVPWDLDRVYEENADEFPFAPGQSIWGREDNYLFARLMESETLRQRHLDNLKTLLGEKFTDDVIKTMLEKQASRIALAFAADRVHGRDGRQASEEATRLLQVIQDWRKEVEQDLHAGPAWSSQYP